MTDSQATTLGRQLVTQPSSAVTAALAALAADDRQKVVLAYLAAGGDPRKIQTTAAGLTQAKGPGALQIAWGIASTISFAASIYHGYKRNDSLGWGLWWGLMGALFPVVTPVVAVAQGYAKPKRRR